MIVRQLCVILPIFSPLEVVRPLGIRRLFNRINMVKRVDMLSAPILQIKFASQLILQNVAKILLALSLFMRPTKCQLP